MKLPYIFLFLGSFGLLVAEEMNCTPQTPRSPNPQNPKVQKWQRSKPLKPLNFKAENPKSPKTHKLQNLKTPKPPKILQRPKPQTARSPKAQPLNQTNPKTLKPKISPA